MDCTSAESAGSGSEQEYSAGVRLVVLNLPEDEGEGLGFRLTRTLWDPYPWVREVMPGSRAHVAGLKTGDCLLQADGKDLLGLPVGQVAGVIRGDGAGRGVSLLAWNCGVDPKDDPELLWSCGGGARGERARRALAGVVRALACCVCAATATRALSCARSHLYCEGCWARLERCALCRESLPAKDSPYARNLVAEQVFEAIAAEYEIKDAVKKSTECVSAVTSPRASPAPPRRRQQFSIIKKKNVQFTDKFSHNYVSDPNIHRSVNNDYTRRLPATTVHDSTTPTTPTDSTGNVATSCSCQHRCHKEVQTQSDVPDVSVEDAERYGSCRSAIQHKLVARLRQACSMVDLQSATHPCPCPITRSLNNINISEQSSPNGHHASSLDSLKNNCGSVCDSPPVFLLSAPPIYLVTCDHNKNQ